MFCLTGGSNIHIIELTAVIMIDMIITAAQNFIIIYKLTLRNNVPKMIFFKTSGAKNAKQTNAVTKSIIKSFIFIPFYHKGTKNGIINAKTPKEMMSYTDPHSGGVWGKKLPKNIGLPPYHFGCRTMIEEVPNALADEYILDEFDRGYKFKENKHKLKYNKHKNEVKGRNYDKEVKETLSNIAYEGTHYREEGKKVIFGSNGFIAYINSNNEIETCYKPTSGFRKFEQDVNIMYYNAIETKLKRFKKWLNIFSW